MTLSGAFFRLRSIGFDEKQALALTVAGLDVIGWVPITTTTRKAKEHVVQVVDRAAVIA